MKILIVLVLLVVVAWLGVALVRRRRRVMGVAEWLQASVDGWRLEEGEAAEAAFASLLAALEGTSRYAEAARRLLDVRAWAWAAAVCRQGLEARPDDAALAFLLACAQTAMLEPEGIHALTRHAKAHPGDVSTRLLLARSLLRLRRLEEVVSLLRRPVEVQDASAEELSLLGQAWFHLGEPAQATRCLERARRVRVERRRYVVSVYEGYTEGGQDLRQAPADFWADEEDRLLLEELGVSLAIPRVLADTSGKVFLVDPHVLSDPVHLPSATTEALMLPTKRILPLSLLLALAVWGGGTGGCSCEDEDPPAVGVSKCPQGCPIGQVCDELGALGCYIPGGSNNTNNPNNSVNNNPTCEDGCAAPEATCEGDVAVSFSGAGECKDGACDFTAVRVEEACDLLCNAGACTTGEAGSYCTSDTHCGEGLFCDVGLKECASGCRLDGCEAGSSCDPESRTCVSECAADANEPNDAAGEETELTFTVGQVASYEELTLCEGDVDLYTIVLSDTQDVAVLLEAPSSGGNLSAALLDPSGAEVVADADARDLQLTAMSMSAGAWTLRVTHGDNAAPATYSVAVRVTDRNSDACVADLFEPNDTGATAAALELEYGNTRSLDDLTLCEGDVDQFSLEAGVGDTLNLSFDPVPAEGLSVRVLNTDTGSDVFQGTITTAGTESWVLDEGEHIIVVSPTAPVAASGLEYGMRALLDAGAVQCVDDSREDNDICANAYNVASPGAAELVLCDDDSADWYSIFVPANQMVNLEAIYTGRNEGTFTMIVYSGSCNGEPAIADRAECADGTCERLPSALNPSVDTTYYVQIQTANADGPISYDLNVAVSGCAPDRYEPNNVNGGDVALPTTCRAEGGVCPGDNDFFKIEVGSGETFSVAAYHNRLQDGDVDLTLYNDMLQIVDTSWTNNDRCEGVDNASSLGGTTYYLRVEVPEGVRNVPYRLVWNGACNQPENQTIPICQ